MARNSTRMSPTLVSKLAGAAVMGGAAGGRVVPGSSAPSSLADAPGRWALGPWTGAAHSRFSRLLPGGVAEGQPGSQSRRRGAASGEEATTE